MATYIHQFQGICINNQAPPTLHMFFADDAMFFWKASSNSCQAISTIINRFCAISGQILNLQKCIDKFSPNIPTENQQVYKLLLRMDSTSSLGTYLRVPIDIQESKVRHLTPLLIKISMKISRWNHINISQPAKLIIITSILIGTIMHYLSVFTGFQPQLLTKSIISWLCIFLEG